LIREEAKKLTVTRVPDFATLGKNKCLGRTVSISWTLVDLASAVAFLCGNLVPPMAIAMALSGIDDLFVDLLFFLRLVQRRKWRKQKFLADDVIGSKTSGYIAVFVPAWNESNVIADMLSATLMRWQDDNQVRLFVGWYINDAATGRAIANIAAHDARVVPVIIPHDGPTTKADCLNHLWVAAGQYAQERHENWTAYLLHDAEDLVSAKELGMVRHMVVQRGKALVQFPVIPVPVPGSPFISGHYLDEFAESHGKDMVVREWMGAPLPAAGVGCAFSHLALQKVATARGGLPFNQSSLTEDYELGLIISRELPAAFVRIKAQSHNLLIATHEHFPDQFWRAVRQKSRWISGISLSGWDSFGWNGNAANFYWMARDRKSLFTFYINASAYVIVALYALLWLWQNIDRTAPIFADVAPKKWIATLLIFNLMVLGWRLIIRAAFVWRLSGLWQALLSVPRALVSNVINICAAFHAICRYLSGQIMRKPMVWDKTAHSFPHSLQLDS
jgi:bacteriophage N4 adsorption protein B